ncbi:YbaB/EbfC family nucleoid-associated protein [Salinispora tropica]|uniref:YbaB/EbfC family nucleoid-associated protein n=1 Tax=Salinispora tropica TaxID=168695 RepID=UPI00048BAAA5|nr:YbaB/EbfC family nucleoid-associated protein [Salinispora tropica]
MLTPYDAELSQLRARYRAQRTALGEMQRALAELSATVIGVQRCVQVTVDAYGQLVELGFPTDAYRQMAPQELATAVFAAVTQAQAEARKAASQTLSSYQSNNSLLELSSSEEDWSRLIPEDLPGLDELLDSLRGKDIESADSAPEPGTVTWSTRNGWAGHAGER